MVVLDNRNFNINCWSYSFYYESFINDYRKAASLFCVEFVGCLKLILRLTIFEILSKISIYYRL